MSIFWQVLLALIAFFVVLPAVGAVLVGIRWLFSGASKPEAPPAPKPKMKLDARTWVAIVAATIGVFAVLGVVGAALR